MKILLIIGVVLVYLFIVGVLVLIQFLSESKDH
jgi:hypothetical protein